MNAGFYRLPGIAAFDEHFVADDMNSLHAEHSFPPVAEIRAQPYRNVCQECSVSECQTVHYPNSATTTERTPLRKAGWVVTSCICSPSIHTSRGCSLRPVMYATPVRAAMVHPPSPHQVTGRNADCSRSQEDVSEVLGLLFSRGI